jgi:hypothetical protein
MPPRIPRNSSKNSLTISPSRRWERCWRRWWRWPALDHRRELCGRQRGGGLGPVRSAPLPQLVSAHHAGDAGTGVSGRRALPLVWAHRYGSARPQRGTAMAEFLLEHGELIPLTLPEVRRLVYRLVVRILAPRRPCCIGPGGGVATKPARLAPTTDAASIDLYCQSISLYLLWPPPPDCARSGTGTLCPRRTGRRPPAGPARGRPALGSA